MEVQRIEGVHVVLAVRFGCFFPCQGSLWGYRDRFWFNGRVSNCRRPKPKRERNADEFHLDGLKFTVEHQSKRWTQGFLLVAVVYAPAVYLQPQMIGRLGRTVAALGSLGALVHKAYTAFP